jgi:hypothetical protein
MDVGAERSEGGDVVVARAHPPPIIGPHETPYEFGFFEVSA